MLRLPLLVLFTAICLVGLAKAADEVEPAVPVRTVVPVYPEELRKQRVDGVVVVAFTVDEKGNVREPQIQKCTRAEFEKPALEAVKKWKFKPARLNGTAVARKVAIPIHFAADNQVP